MCGARLLHWMNLLIRDELELLRPARVMLVLLRVTGISGFLNMRHARINGSDVQTQPWASSYLSASADIHLAV